MPNKTKLVFDPGHGGRDPGTIGPTTYEKNNVLALAIKTAAWLEKTGQFRVKFTRKTDKDFCNGYFNTDSDLQSRVKVAEALGGSAMVSFHNNSYAGTTPAYGNEVYAYQAGTPAEKLAKAVNARMRSRLGMLDRGVKFAPWYVCRKLTMPAILIEYGFIKSEEQVILQKMNLTALIIAQGIGDYFNVEIGGNKMEKVILLNSGDDFWVAKDVDAFLGGEIPVMVRRVKGGSAPALAMSAEDLYVIGGPKTGHPKEHYMSGHNKYETAARVGDFLAGKIK